MNVHIPKAGDQVLPVGVDYRGISAFLDESDGCDPGDAAVLYDYGKVGLNGAIPNVDDVDIREHKILFNRF